MISWAICTLKPRSSSRFATLLEYSSNCLKVHLSPVPSKMSAVLSPCRCTVSAKILGMVFFSLRWRLTFNFTRNNTTAALTGRRNNFESILHSCLSLTLISYLRLCNTKHWKCHFYHQTETNKMHIFYTGNDWFLQHTLQYYHANHL